MSNWRKDIPEKHIVQTMTMAQRELAEIEEKQAQKPYHDVILALKHVGIEKCIDDNRTELRRRHDLP
jgi:hypothetical protein